MGKLVHYCRNYLPVIIIALVLGAAGTICQIIRPDKLKDMTNEIVKGLPACRERQAGDELGRFQRRRTASPGCSSHCTSATRCSATCKAG